MSPLAIAALLLVCGLAVPWLIACALFSAEKPRLQLPAAELQARLPRFPAGFLFGCATSAHQLDGGAALNDWSRFEEEPGRIAGGDKSGIATGHRERVVEDAGLLGALGANALRFSLEWARLEPEEGRWDEAEWQRALEEARLLRGRGIALMATLLHFTLPRWIADRGGPEAPGFPDRFGRFAAEAARRLGGEVALFATLNEPNVMLFQGWILGAWPPGKRDPAAAARAFAGLCRGHAAAVQAVRAHAPQSSVGPVVDLIEFEPASRLSLLDWLAVRAGEAAFDWAFLDSIRDGRIRFSLPGGCSVDEPAPELRGTADWIGVNYYTRLFLRFAPREPGMVRRVQGPGEHSDLGWELRPEGLLLLLRATWERYRLPLHLTETGLADAADSRRARFLRAYLHACARAIAAGADLRGFFHWSLLDNFEWAEGFAPRFGLYAVDYATLARTPRPSAAAFRALLAEAQGESRLDGPGPAI